MNTKLIIAGCLLNINGNHENKLNTSFVTNENILNVIPNLKKIMPILILVFITKKLLDEDV